MVNIHCPICNKKVGEVESRKQKSGEYTCIDCEIEFEVYESSNGEFSKNILSK